MLSCGDGVTKELKSLSYKIKLLAQCASEDNSKVNFVEPTKKEWFTTYAKGFGTSDLKSLLSLPLTQPVQSSLTRLLTLTNHHYQLNKLHI